jgi:hypothetical protein
MSITIASLLNLYGEAGLPLEVLTQVPSSSIGVEGSGATYHWGEKVVVWWDPTGVDNELLGRHLRHEFVHHLQWLQDKESVQPLGEKRDSNSLPKGVSASYWEDPAEAEARYYEYHPKDFDWLIQEHGYSALEWECKPPADRLLNIWVILLTLALGWVGQQNVQLRGQLHNPPPTIEQAK